MASLAFADPARVAENVRPLVAVASSEGSASGRLDYFEALNRIQTRRLRLDDLSGGQQPQLVFEFDHADDRKVVEHLLEGEELRDSHVYPAAARDRIEARITAGYALLTEFDRDALALVEALVVRIFFAHKSGFGGASVADMLGCIWLSPPTSWEPIDYAEGVYHETVHQALFLEEMVRGVYAADPAKMATADGHVVSAIRKEKRPFDASFHAACVAAALVDLYRTLDRPERVETLVEGLEPSVNEMSRKEEYLNEGGRKILGELRLCIA
jgi:HEXXH motif-containing protein